ncbi:hypothetical protein [Pseudonocardia sp.]|uniref:hypothetical protein n=1 Tax=Pseudonocardia sp. TaxID=60912 RepID=UPI00261C6E42|nr:hypothetical protein [Pseudonocardia sp.]
MPPGDPQFLGERPFGLVDVVQPGDPAQHLQRAARRLGVLGPARGLLRAAGQLRGLARPALAERDVRGQRVDPWPGVGPGRAAAPAQLRLGRIPRRRGGGRLGEEQVDVRAAVRVEVGARQPVPDRADRVAVPGVSHHLQERLVDLDRARRARPGQVPGSVEQLARRAQRAVGQGCAAAHEQQPGRVVVIAGRDCHVGGDLGPDPRQAGMTGLDRDPGPPRQVRLLRRGQAGEYGVAGQGVTERELAVGDREELSPDAATQGPADVVVGPAHHLGRDRLVEPPAEHRTGQHDVAVGAGQRPEPLRDPRGERGGDDAVRARPQHPPGAVPPQGAPVRGRCQQFLDQERHAAGAGQHVHQAVREVDRAQAPGRHGGDLLRNQRWQVHHGGGPPGTERSGRDPARRIRPGGGEDEHPLLGDVVGQVLDDREGVRIAPVQVVEHQHRTAARAPHREQPEHSLAQHDRRLGGSHHVVAAPLRHDPAQRRPVGPQAGVAAGGERCPRIGSADHHDGAGRCEAWAAPRAAASTRGCRPIS